MDTDQQDDHGLLLAWILGIAVTIAIAVSLLTGIWASSQRGTPGASAPATPAATLATPAAATTSSAPLAPTPAPATAMQAAGTAATGTAAAAGAIATVEAVRIYFETGKASLDANDLAKLAPIADAVKAGRIKGVSISGYHDATGSPERNAVLARQRAEMVAKALSAAGVAEAAIELRKPVQMVGSSDNREARRVEVTPQ